MALRYPFKEAKVPAALNDEIEVGNDKSRT